MNYKDVLVCHYLPSPTMKHTSNASHNFNQMPKGNETYICASLGSACVCSSVHAHICTCTWSPEDNLRDHT